jgi:serine/threonine protein kinase
MNYSGFEQHIGVVCTNEAPGNGLICGNVIGPSALVCSVCDQDTTDNRKQALLPGINVSGDQRNYRILALIGQGGFGQVYMASTKPAGNHHDTVVALKTTDLAVAQPLTNAQLQAIDHPVLPRFYEAFDANNIVFSIMEFIPGITLHQMMEAYPNGMDETDAMRLLWPIMYGVEYLHNGGSGIKIIHRDVKPRNILFGPDGSAKLVDLGLVKSVTNDYQTRLLPRAGTPRYAAPDQMTGGATESVDIHALNVILYEMMTGLRYPDVYDRMANPQKYRDEARSNLKARRVSPHIINTIMGGLEHDPSRRIQRVSDLRASLSQGKQFQGFTAPLVQPDIVQKITRESAQLILPELVGKVVYLTYHDDDKKHAEIIARQLRQCGVQVRYRDDPLSVVSEAKRNEYLKQETGLIAGLRRIGGIEKKKTIPTPTQAEIIEAIQTSDITFTLLSSRSQNGINSEADYERSRFGFECDWALNFHGDLDESQTAAFNIVVDSDFLQRGLINTTAKFYLLEDASSVIRLRYRMREALKRQKGKA